MPDMNLTNVKLTDQVPRYEIDGHEIERQDIISFKNGLYYNAVCNFFKTTAEQVTTVN